MKLLSSKMNMLWIFDNLAKTVHSTSNLRKMKMFQSWERTLFLVSQHGLSLWKRILKIRDWVAKNVVRVWPRSKIHSVFCLLLTVINKLNSQANRKHLSLLMALWIAKKNWKKKVFWIHLSRKKTNKNQRNLKKILRAQLISKKNKENIDNLSEKRKSKFLHKTMV